MIQIISTFVMLSLLTVYFFLNLLALGEGSSGLKYLGGFFIIGAITILVQTLLSKKLKIKKSFFVLILFFIYFVVRIVIDTQDTEMLKALTIGTNGGTVLWYVAGLILGNSIVNIKNILAYSKQLQLFYILITSLFLIIFGAFFIQLLLETLSLIRTDIFLIKDGSNYQRIGGFLFMMFMVVSFFVNLAVINFKSKNLFVKSMLLGTILIFLILTILSMLYSQLIGSNNTLINLSILLISSVILYLFLLAKNGFLNLYNNLIFKRNIFTSKITKKVYYIFLLAILVILIVLYSMIIYFDIDITKFRILGFGTEGMTSVNSRLELWNNFFVHLDYSLLMGNMGVDTYTTGTGTYVHSLVGSLLTHLGLFGFVLFFAYVYLAIKENITSKRINYGRLYDNSIFIYSLVLFVSILLVASVGVFFTWTPIWFLFGLIFPAFNFTDKKE